MLIDFIPFGAQVILGVLYGVTWGAVLLFTAFYFEYIDNDWRGMQYYVIYGWALLIIFFYLLPESPLYQLEKGQIKEAFATLDTIARINGKESVSQKHPDLLTEERIALAKSAVPINNNNFTFLFTNI